VWEVRAFVGRDDRGKPVQVSRTVRGGKRDAQRVAAELKVKPATQSGRRTVAELLADWQELRDSGWAPTTVSANRNRVKSLLEDKISTVAVGRLQVVDVEAWIARLRKRGVGEGSIRNQLQVLRAALTQAQRWGWVTQNPAALVTLTRPKRVARGVMSDDEVNRVLTAAETLGERELLALRLAAITGARRAEVGALQWSDFDGNVVRIDSALVAVRVTDERSGTVHTEIYDTPTKTGDLRIVTLDADTLDLVANGRATYGSGGPWLFSDGPEPPHPGRVGWWWKQAKELAEIDTCWRLHDLRHWSATHGVSEGFDMATVSGRLGHSDASTTLRVYAHAQSREDQKLATSLGNALRRQ
jgi:integrase